MQHIIIRGLLWQYDKERKEGSYVEHDMELMIPDSQFLSACIVENGEVVFLEKDKPFLLREKQHESYANDAVVIMRKPCIPEDIGRYCYVKTCDEISAKTWIAAQEHEYFKPSDYFITRKSTAHV